MNYVEEAINILIELQALMSEREGMIVANQERESQGLAYAYGEDAFLANADAMRVLKYKEQSHG